MGAEVAYVPEAQQGLPGGRSGDKMSKDVAEPRIGSGLGWFYAAAGAFLFALLFSTFGGMLESPLAAAGGRLCVALTVLFIAVGFCTRLFGLLERRLIDIQQALQTKD